jgi:hypothetical protein
MPIRVQCSCGKRLAFPDGTEGRYGKCKQCGQPVLIEQQTQDAQPDPAAGGGGEQPASTAYADNPQWLPGYRGQGGDAVVRADGQHVRPRGFWSDVGRSFVFFTDTDNLFSFLIVVVVNALIRMSDVMAVLGAFAFGMFVGAWILRCWLFAFLINTITEIARGEDTLPSVSVSDVWEDLVRPAWLFVASMVLVEIPAIVLLVARPDTTAIHLPWILALVGLFCWPAAILMVAIGDGFRALWPHLVLRTILSAFGAYVAVWCLLLLAALPIFLPILVKAGYVPGWPVAFGDAGGPARIVSGLLGCVAESYTMVVSMRLIGLYYRHFKGRFPWRAE